MLKSSPDEENRKIHKFWLIIKQTKKKKRAGRNNLLKDSKPALNPSSNT